jgi:hypothetical protein
MDEITLGTKNIEIIGALGNSRYLANSMECGNKFNFILQTQLNRAYTTLHYQLL